MPNSYKDDIALIKEDIHVLKGILADAVRLFDDKLAELPTRAYFSSAFETLLQMQETLMVFKDNFATADVEMRILIGKVEELHIAGKQIFNEQSALQTNDSKIEDKLLLLMSDVERAKDSVLQAMQSNFRQPLQTKTFVYWLLGFTAVNAVMIAGAFVYLHRYIHLF